LAKVKTINRRQGSDLIGANFRNAASETIFTFGRFTVDTNFSSRKVRNYSNELSSFVTPITLQTLNISKEDSDQIFNFNQNVVLNINKSDLTSYARFGSMSEILRVSIENIIIQFPSSIYVTYQISSFSNLMSVTNYFYDITKDSSVLTIPYPALVNKFGIVLNQFNNQLPQNDPLRNLNIAFPEYVLWREENSTGHTFEILGYTGYTATYQYINLSIKGNPFPELSGSTQGKFNYHIKPKPIHYNRFKKNLSTLESYIINDKIAKGYKTEFQTPTELEDGSVSYNNQIIIWPSADGYNIDISGYDYDVFLNLLGGIGQLYDQFKSDLIARLLVPESLLKNDLTEDSKLQKLLRLYGTTFDNIKVFIDALVTINKLSYNKNKNIPDILVKNLAKTLGWEGVTLVQEDDLLESFFSTEDKKSTDLLPPEVDVELWRRILINTNHLFKSKGTREAMKSILLMVGIPEPFIDITEYVYTVKGKIDPNTVTISLADLPCASLPYNSSGYPIAPKENKFYYFQVSGNTDSGQAYLDVFRTVGFNLNRVIDNKKSWVYGGSVARIDATTPTYLQEDSALIINTKEVDVSLDIARGIEYDMYSYNVKHNFPLSSTGVTKPFLYINIPFTYGSSASIFTVPEVPQGDIQVSFNGVTLVKGFTSGDVNADYHINTLNTKEVILNSSTAQSYTNGFKDIITLTYAKDQQSGGTYSQIQYIVTKVTTNPDGIVIPIIDTTLGEIQLVVNGVTMTKSNSLFTGDYIINPANPHEILVVNNDLKNYLIAHPVVVISYIKSNVFEPVLKKSEVHRIDSFSGTKFFYNSGIGKYVYVLDYEPPSVVAVKIIVNGITLQNGSDFILNSSNKRQVLFNTTALNLGYIINAFYVTDDGSISNPINFGNFILPNISQISFLQYLDIINNRLINVKNRKTLSDHNGGLYPTVERLYDEYLKRGYAVNPLLVSNAYTFGNVYPFMKKFNSFFHKFIEELLGSTIILKKGGILIRNTAFTKQKFTYRRGVNFDPSLKYYGNDGSEFKKRVPTATIDFLWSGLTCVVVGTPSTTTAPATTAPATTAPATTAPATTAPVTTAPPPRITYYGYFLNGLPNTWSFDFNDGGGSHITQSLTLAPDSFTGNAILHGSSFTGTITKLTNGGLVEYGLTTTFYKNGIFFHQTNRSAGASATDTATFTTLVNGDVISIEVYENLPPPPAPNCLTYHAVNNSDIIAFVFEYQDCLGFTQTSNIPAGGNSVFCAYEGSFVAGTGTGSINVIPNVFC
jgi:hypothetical protein